jgi:hypothetical protein
MAAYAYPVYKNVNKLLQHNNNLLYYLL